ncbi:amidohydrolase family protein [Microvirga arabica]|uniref:amidohydrolase family protein n=1 Tax=Microvirga arabica TaxID=1128671 RepID=UPI00193AD31B|nr:amidohydrolase family protein [Microvirga arabica]MBM1174030.1 amidohydrolase family protein [Microvirga arabica]
MIIDAHCHGGKGDLMTAPWNTDAPLRDYLARADAAGIQRTVIFPAFNSDYARANAELGQIVRRHAPRLIGFAFVHCARDAGRIRGMVADAVQRYGFQGIKIHGADALPNREVCEAAREFQLPILVDVVGKAEVVDMIAPQYPDVPFIIPHLGSFADDWRAHERVVEQLVRYPNVYTDTSGVRRFDYLVAAVRRAGASKVIFGSDGPWLHPGLELHKVRLLGLSKDAERRIMGGNILRLLSRRRQSVVGLRPVAA